MQEATQAHRHERSRAGFGCPPRSMPGPPSKPDFTGPKFNLQARSFGFPHVAASPVKRSRAWGLRSPTPAQLLC